MSNIAFPQLSSGAQAQYPFRKRRVIQSTVNTFADGSILTSNINANTQTVWELSYTDLNSIDQTALQNHFVACQGPLQAFVFIDPTDNMLSNSSDLTQSAWIGDGLLSVTPGATDPLGGTTAFTLVNSGQAPQSLLQQVSVPADYQYCFSVYASAAVPTSVALDVAAVSSQEQTFPLSANWVRLVNAARLPDQQMSVTVSIVVPPAQTVVLWGPQLEPQLSPSRYRATAAAGGVYPNAHLLGNSITFESQAPGLFSTLISIETT